MELEHIILILLALSSSLRHQASAISHHHSSHYYHHQNGHRYHHHHYHRQRSYLRRQFHIHSFCDDSINAICSHTSYPILCTYAAHTYGHAYPVIDIASLFSMQIRLATDHTKSAKAVALRFATQPLVSARVKKALGVCLNLYDDALDDLAKGNSSAIAHDAGTSNSMLSAVISYYSTCNDAFTEILKSNPMAKQDYFLIKMVSNALAIAKLMLEQGN